MKALFSTLAIGAISLFLCATPARSFQEPDKDRQEPEKQKPEEKPKPEKGKPADTTHREDSPKSEARPEANKPPAEREQPARGQEARPQENRERGNAKMERTGNHNSYRIPDDRFRGHFGRSHVFHVERGAREFAFGGFNFTFVDPWPAEWAYTDDVYVDFIDGEYYLIDPVHPGIRVLVIVVG
jgi:hypothetical protein